MKRISFLLTFLLIASFAIAQNKNVNKATRAHESGELAEAKEYIDEAMEHEKTVDKGKTWYTAAMIYESIGQSEDAEIRSLDEDALGKAMKFYRKIFDLEKENNTYYQFGDQRLQALWGTLLNQGADLYQQQEFKAAYDQFELAQKAQPEDTTAYFYGGIAAQQAEMYDVALKNYYQLIDLNFHERDIYLSIAYLERAINEDADQALKVLRMALEQFPGDSDIKKEEINILITQNRVDEALDKISATLEDEPGNEVLHYNKGFILEETGDLDGALASYKRAAEAKPDYYEAHFNVGALYYNQAAEILKESNNLDLKEYQKRGKELEAKAVKKFEKAKPYFEKAMEIKPDDVAVLQTLRTVYAQLEMDDKSKEVVKRLEALGVSDDD
ncbi:MAG: tetratricopeptide repeat protein [Cyclobacteriaceae bacterium]|nr:tetratricopeptide repeat protein [Cyclobacteriaceae bacterium]MCH8516439.1 tetratricopeptide repeat protein [Cyclobacteriaceae bacterium]